MGHPIPFLSLESIHQQLQGEVDAAFRQVYDNNKFILGNKLVEFENVYAQFSQVAYCAGVGCGLDAISLSLKALSIGPGDEVIVPSNTFIATWIAVSNSGAMIVPVEPNKTTYNIDITKIGAAITGRTKAIIAVHLYGQPCEMDALLAIASRFHLHLIEDNAQAHGAAYNGKNTGSFGIINATSFYPTKNLGALGDGGAITTNDEVLFRKVCTLRNYGSAEKNYNEVIGVNSRLDELQAAVLIVKLGYLRAWNTARQKIADAYSKGLDDISELILPKVAGQATAVFHLYVVRTTRRNDLQAHLEKAQIGTMIHYPVPPHLQSAYKDLNYREGHFPIAEELAKTSLSLPVWPGMTADMVDHVISEVRSFFK